jgi:hypothetical protein
MTVETHVVLHVVDLSFLKLMPSSMRSCEWGQVFPEVHLLTDQAHYEVLNVTNFSLSLKLGYTICGGKSL